MVPLQGGHIIYSKFMTKNGKSSIIEEIPRGLRIEFNVIQDLGNLGIHYQTEKGEVTTRKAERAIYSLNEIIDWIFPKKPERHIWITSEEKIDTMNEILSSATSKKYIADAIPLTTLFSKYIYSEKYNIDSKINLDKMFKTKDENMKNLWAEIVDHAEGKSISRSILVTRAIELLAGENGWAPLTQVVSKMSELDDSFTISSIGYKEFVGFVESKPELFELRRTGETKLNPPRWEVRTVSYSDSSSAAAA